jgi:hypothetical protein
MCINSLRTLGGDVVMERSNSQMDLITKLAQCHTRMEAKQRDQNDAWATSNEAVR